MSSEDEFEVNPAFKGIAWGVLFGGAMWFGIFKIVEAILN